MTACDAAEEGASQGTRDFPRESGSKYPNLSPPTYPLFSYQYLLLAKPNRKPEGRSSVRSEMFLGGAGLGPRQDGEGGQHVEWRMAQQGQPPALSLGPLPRASLSFPLKSKGGSSYFSCRTV